MTIFYPDISAYQAGISLAGVPAVCVKATEGSFYANPDYDRVIADAAGHGVFAFAYHFLHAGQAESQAAWCQGLTGGRALMIDAEPSAAGEPARARPRFETALAGEPMMAGPGPALSDVTEFAAAYRALGGTCHLVYLPRWYWQRLGEPSLQPLADAGLRLVSSDYTGYSDTGPGWVPYGGMTPDIWQFSSAYPLNGYLCDFNACKHGLAGLRSLVTTGSPRKEKPMIGGQITGAKLDIALPDGISHIRFFCSVDAEISVDLRQKGARSEKLALTYASAHSLAIPPGVHAIVVHVTRPAADGTPVSYAIW